jgi:RecB family endonuclease NucS
MRLVIATCSVDYEGRLSAHLPVATRLLLVKADGSVSIHADGGAYKPLNWMTPPCRLIEAPDRWVVTNPRGEALTITIQTVHSDVRHELGADPGLEKDGVEAHLQQLLAARPEVLLAGLRLIRREFPTDIGPVDLLCRDAEGRAVAVEIKRRVRPVRGILAAQHVKPQAEVLATARGIACVVVDYDALRGRAQKDLTLF